MIRISQLKLPIRHEEKELLDAIARTLKLPKEKIMDYILIKKSIDARKKNEMKYIYTVDVTIITDQKETEEAIIKRSKSPNITLSETAKYSYQPDGVKKLATRPVIVGTGPAGLFCAWLFAKHGYQPLIIERGYDVDSRVAAVERFWKENILNHNSNVQFGEGGAGTFSDGKLNTMVKDAQNRGSLVFETLVSYGAPSEILYMNKPHIGTDKLRTVVKNMRNDIIKMGGEVRFCTTLTNLSIKSGKLTAIEVNAKERIPCEILITAIGHSARDTFRMLLENGLLLSPKPFAIGLRIEHKQSMINRSQYGDNDRYLPPADYKLTHQTNRGRGVYSFCMCPGGYVVNASSEVGHLAVNGMSNYSRNEKNANSAIVVTVGPEDFKGNDPLGGIEFQRKWEALAYQTGMGNIPVQLFGDFVKGKESTGLGSIAPNSKGNYRLTDLTKCLPSDIIESLIEGIQAFDLRIKGFADEEAILSGVETRTSSPVRIHRDEWMESNIIGIYPCGEGAGYAGGITSAAMDGIKVFEAIASQYLPS